MLFSLFFKAFVTFLVVIAPIKVAPLFSILTKGKTIAKRQSIALRAVIIATIILLVFAVFGNWLLDMLSINVYSFRIAGGFLLLVLGIGMVFEKNENKKTDTELSQDKDHHDIAVFPLSIPLIAGPGTITTVILLTDSDVYNAAQQGVVCTALLLVLLITYLCFLGVSFLMRWLGEGVMNVIGRILGVIVVALAFQMIIQGIQVAFGLPAH